MRSRTMVGLVTAVLLGACAPYSEMGGQTYLGFTLGVSSAPTPPRVVLVERDRYERLPGSSVIVIRDPGADCDVFQYGSAFYMYYGGFWYRSYSPDGSFLSIDVRRVPGAVLRVPPERWRHHPHGGPPGQTRKWKDRGRHDDHDD